MAVTSWRSIGWDGWVGVVGTFVTVIALGEAIRQGRAAKRAANAAETAAVQARNAAQSMWGRVNAIHLQASVPHLRLVATAIARAAQQADPYWTEHHLRDWRAQASKLQGHLKANSEDELAAKMNVSTNLASEAMGKIAGGADVSKATAKLRTNIDSCVDLLEAFASEANLTKEISDNAS